ncbi:hypothetical protein HDU76_004328 [Blyttiomyces sp. JEL0837]|nr:hypothetical protein HDU76_004328 [Blyttiomyces sp. JEL0837]
MTPNHVASDFFFLEDTYRIADNATRETAPIKASARRTNPSIRFQLLSKNCGFRKVDFRLMPAGLKRHDENRSIYNTKSKIISWTVEWTLVDAANISIIDDLVPETMSLRDALQRMLDKQKKDEAGLVRIGEYAGKNVSDVYVYLRKERTPANKPHYISVSMEDSLEAALKYRVIVEYPTFVVCMAPKPKEEIFTRIQNIEISSSGNSWSLTKSDTGGGDGGGGSVQKMEGEDVKMVSEEDDDSEDGDTDVVDDAGHGHPAKVVSIGGDSSSSSRGGVGVLEASEESRREDGGKRD